MKSRYYFRFGGYCAAILLLMCGSALLWSQEDSSVEIAVVRSVEGVARLSLPGALRPVLLEAGTVVRSHSVVSTTDGAVVVFELVADGSVVTLARGARMRFRSPDEFHQERGIAYYDIVPRRGGDSPSSGLRVVTEFAVAGIRGTEFIVNAEMFSPAILLSTGELSIESVDDEDFAVVRRNPLDSAEDFRQQRQEDFQNWRRQIMEEFIEYKREFTLSAGRQVLFNGRRVAEEELDADSEALFPLFRSLSGR